MWWFLLKLIIALYVASIVYNCAQMMRCCKKVMGQGRISPLYILVNLNPIRTFIGTYRFFRDPDWLINKLEDFKNAN